MFDTEGSNKIDAKELKIVMRALGFESKKEEIRKIILDVDREGTSQIEYGDFLDIMTVKMKERDPVEEMKKAFSLFLDDNSDRISLKNLKKVARDLGETMTDEELQEMIDEADREGNGTIFESDFIRIMNKTNLF